MTSLCVQFVPPLPDTELSDGKQGGNTMGIPHRVRISITVVSAWGAILLGLGPSGWAATKDWSGAPGAAYTVGTNWTGGVPANDLTSDVARFNAGAGTVSMTAIRSVGGINLISAGWTLDGFTLAGSTTNASASVTGLTDPNGWAANTMVVTATPTQWTNWATVSALALPNFTLAGARGPKGTTTGATSLNFYAPLSVGTSGLISRGGGTNTINVPVSIGANALTVGNAADPTGSTLTLNRGLASAAGSSITLNAGADLSNSTLNIVGDGTNAAENLYGITGAGNLNLTVQADGGFVFNTNNAATFTGTTTMIASPPPLIGSNGPYVTLNVAGALGTGNVALGGATSGTTIPLTVANGLTYTNPLTIGATGRLILNTGASTTSWTGNITVTGDANIAASFDTPNAVVAFGQAGKTITNNGSTVGALLRISSGSPYGAANTTPETINIDSAIVDTAPNTLSLEIGRNNANQPAGGAYTTIFNNTGNTYSGATTIYGGTLKAGASNTFSPKSSINLTTATTALDFNGTTQVIGGLWGAAGSPVLNCGTLTIGNNTTGQTGGTYAGTLATGNVGAVAINLPTGQTETFSGANTYTGGTTLTRGALAVNGNGALGGAAGPLTFDGGTLRYTATTNGGGDISGRTVTIGSGGATIDTNGQTVTYANAIGNSGSGGFTKLGAGTLTLNGNNTFTGSLTVNGGTVVDNGTNAITGGTFILGGATLRVSNNSALNGGAVQITDGSGGGGQANSTLDVLTPALAVSNIVSLPLNQAAYVTSSGGTALAPGGGIVIGAATSNSTNLANAFKFTGNLRVTWASSGTMAFPAANTFNGGLFITNGTVTSGSDANTLAAYNAVTAPNSFITISNNATYSVGGAVDHPIVLGTGGGTLLGSMSFATTAPAITGTGPLTLSGATYDYTVSNNNYVNSYSGGTILSNRRTYLPVPNANTAVTNLSTGDVTIGNGTLLYVQWDGPAGGSTVSLGSAVTPAALNVTSNSTLAFGRNGGSNSNNVFVSGLTLGNGAVLTGQSIAYTQAYGYYSAFNSVKLRTGGGTLNPGIAGLSVTGPVTVDDSVATGTTTTLGLDGGNGNAVTISGPQTVSGNLSDNATDSTKKLALAVTNAYGANGLGNNAYYTWYVTGANTHSGGTTVQSGTTQPTTAYFRNTGATNVLQAFGTGPVSLLSYGGGVASVYLQANGSASGATIATGNNLRVGLAPGGTAGTYDYLTVDRYSGTNTGGTFAMGALTFDSGANLSVTGNNSYGLSFTSLSIPDTVTTTISTTGTPTITVNGTGTPSTGRMSFTNTAANINLNAAAAWTGGTNLVTKTVKIGNAGALTGAAGTGPVTINGTTLDATSNTGTPTAGVMLGNVTWTNTNYLTSSGALGGGFILGNGTSYNLSLNGANTITGTTAITWNSTGTLGIGAANNYTGGTTINSGILQAGNTAAALGTGKITIGAGKLFWYQSNTNTANMTLTSAFSQIQGYWGIFSGNIDGTGTLNYIAPDGNYPATFTGNNTYLGGTTLTNSGAFVAFQNPAATNSVPAISTGVVTLTGTGTSGGLVSVQANGSGSSQTITVGNGAAVPVAVTGGTGNNLTATRKDGSNTGNTFAFGTLSLGGGAAVTICGTNAIGNKTSFAGINLLTGGGTIGGNNNGGNFNAVLVPAGGTITVDSSVATGTTTALTIEGGNSQNGALADVYAANAVDNGTRKLAINVRSQNYGYRGSVYLTGTNAFTGGFSVYGDATNQLRVYAQDTTTTNNYLTAAGQGPISLYVKGTSQYPYLNLNANGSGSGQSINVGDATTKADLNVRMAAGGTAGATGYLVLDRYNGSNTGNTLAFNQLTLDPDTVLAVTGNNGYGASFTGLSVPSGTATLSLSGAGSSITVTGTGTPGTGTLKTNGANGARIVLNGPAAWTGGTIMTVNGVHTVVAGHRNALGGFVEVNSWDTLSLNAAQIDIAGIRTTNNNGNPVKTMIEPGFAGAVTLYDNVPTGQTFSYVGQLCANTDANTNLRLIKDGLGTQELMWANGVSYFSGGIELRQGELVIGNWQGSPQGTGGSGPVTFNGGIVGARWSYGTNLNNGAGFSSTAQYNPTTFNGGIDVIDAPIVFTLVGLGGSGAFQKLGPGTVQFNAGTYNAFSGLMTVSAGTVNINGQTVGAGGLAGSGTITNASATTASTLTVSGPGTSTFAGTLTNGSRALTLTNSGGTLILSGTNSYTGVTTVGGGTLQFATTASLYTGNTTNWTPANINVKSGATLAFNVGGASEFTTGNVSTLLANLGTSSSAANGMNAGSAIGLDTTNAAGGTFTLADAIANTTGAGGGAVGLTKLGTNTLALTATSTYTGPTTVSNGTLLLQGGNLNGTSALTVAGGATFGGNGTVTTAGGVTATGSGAGTRAAVSPGMSIGTLNVTGNATLGDCSSLVTELDRVGGADLFAVTGNLNLSSLTDRLDLWTLGGNVMSEIYTVATYGSVTGTFNEIYLNGVPVTDYIGGNYWLVYGAGGLTLVPEPAALTLLAAGLVLLRRRRR